MKNLLFPLLFFATLFSCDKEPGDLKFSQTIPGGCSIDKGISAKNVFASDIDEVTYSIINGNLELLVGFNATCCGEYSTSSQVIGDTIIVEILTTKIGLCDCICYYTYNFKFIGSGEKYKYKVTVDDYLTFSGEINP